MISAARRASSLSLGLLIFATLVVRAHAGEGEPKPLRPDWLARDVANVERLRPILENPPAEIDALVEKLDGDLREDHDLGFGGRHVSVAVYGGYTTCWFEIVAFEDEVAGCDLLHQLEYERKEVKARIEKAWDGFGEAEDRGISYSYRRPSWLEAFREKVARALGSVVEVHVPESLREAYTLLTDPFRLLTYGEACYDSGAPPLGRNAIGKLDGDQHLDLVRNILRGPNPVGRVYAAELLITREGAGRELSKEDRETLSKIRALKIPIRTCSGCIVQNRTAVEIIDELRAR